MILEHHARTFGTLISPREMGSTGSTLDGVAIHWKFTATWLLTEVKITIFPPYPFSCVGVLKVDYFDCACRHIRWKLLAQKNLFSFFFPLEQNLDIQHGNIFPNVPCTRVLTTIWLHAKISCVRSMWLFGNPFCFWVSGNVRFEQISFLTMSNFWRQSKLLNFSLKNQNSLSKYLILISANLPVVFERKIMNHKPNLIWFNIYRYITYTCVSKRYLHTKYF